MANHNKAGFLFDLDGVLIDSEREYSRIWAQVNKEYPSGTESLEKVIKGCTLDKILNDHYPDHATRVKVVKRLYELEGLMKYEYLPGAENLLKTLKRLNQPIVLVTSSNDDKMAHLDEEIPELRRLFDFIVTADLITRSKPDPEGYLLGAKKIGKNITNCIVFEDSLQGVKAGRNAGAFVIGIAGTMPREALEPFSDLVIDSLTELDPEMLIKTATERDEQ